MICINCNSDDMVGVFEEEYPCKHCGGVNIIEYYLCEQCGFMCKVVDGEFLDGIALQEDRVTDAAFTEFLNDIGDNPLHVEGQLMSSFIHRCLQCNTPSYEKEENLWHCPECGFEWEIIGVG